MAALAGLEMRLRGWDLQVTTFGEPRVGNEAFVEFLDERFGLVHLDDDGLGEGRRFRRVTHAEDPVPLLPLEEWGYKMHAGEIYILKPDLEPSASDIRLCEGVDDPTCIAGSGSQASMAEVKSIARDGASRSDLGRRSQDQTVLSNGRLDYWSQTQSPFSVRWDLIPARYRLWELLFAHRDYFSRLGLCVPGGDPTGLKAFGMENTDI